MEVFSGGFNHVLRDTPREKFYLALAEACTPSSDHSQDVEYQKAGWSLALSLNKFLPKLGINSHVFGA
jgi:hypothetical protein